jgi:amidohydrolase
VEKPVRAPRRASDMSAAAFGEIVREAVSWRRELHKVPELRYELPRTQAFVAARLREMGCDEVRVDSVPGAVIAVLRGRLPAVAGGPCVALRADMDALPIAERSGVAHTSQRPGCMHACGHDGHMAMLLGATRVLAADRNFHGSLLLIFQPAEEGGAGAQAIVQSGLLDAERVAEVYGVHNWPQLPVGHIALRPGPLMGSVHHITGGFTGKGGHAAAPHLSIDAVLAASNFICAVQSLVSREVDPVDSAVISITRIAGGTTDNVLPDRVEIEGTLRTLSDAAAKTLPARIESFARDLAKTFRTQSDVSVELEYPVTVNDAACAEHAHRAAVAAVTAAHVDPRCAPTLLAEDFAFMLQARPGAFVFLGTGPSPNLHDSTFDFNDAAVEPGIRYWCEIARMRSAALNGR